MTLLELLQLLRKHLRLVVLLPVAFAVVTGVYAFFLPNQYTASTSMYVLSKSSSPDGTTVTQGDLSASQMLTNDVSSIIKSDRVKGDVATQLGRRREGRRGGKRAGHGRLERRRPGHERAVRQRD